MISHTEQHCHFSRADIRVRCNGRNRVVIELKMADFMERTVEKLSYTRFFSNDIRTTLSKMQ